MLHMNYHSNNPSNVLLYVLLQLITAFIYPLLFLTFELLVLQVCAIHSYITKNIVYFLANDIYANNILGFV